MEAEKVVLEKKKQKSGRRSKRIIVDSITPDYFPSTLPSRDLEVPSVTTRYTISDYLKEDMATPRDRQFEDKLEVVPIPREKAFVDVPELLTAFLHEVTSSENSNYTCTSIDIENVGQFFVLKLREKYFPKNPSRVVLLPQHLVQRTFGVFTTEKTLPAVLEK